MAALFTNASRRSPSPPTRSMTAWTSSSRETSAAKNLLASGGAASARRSVASTHQPASAKARTVALPMPPAAPVTRTTDAIALCSLSCGSGGTAAVRPNRPRQTQAAEQVLDSAAMNPFPGPGAAVGVVRRQQDIVHRAKWAGGRKGLLWKHVQAGAGDLPFPQAGHQRLLVHHGAPGGVDQNGRSLPSGERTPI